MINNLYSYKDIDGYHYFIEKGLEFYQLTDEYYILTDGSIRYLKASNEYIGFLKTIYSDASKLQYEIDNSMFDRNSLMQITVDYHNLVCPGKSCIIYEKETNVKK